MRVDTLYLCNGERICNKSAGCYKNGGDCKHTADDRFHLTKGESNFKIELFEGDYIVFVEE